MTANNRFKSSSLVWIALTIFVVFVTNTSCQSSTSPAAKVSISRTPSEIEDLKNGKYTGGSDVDEILYKTTTTTKAHSTPASATSSIKNDPAQSNPADLMLADSDPDNVIEEVAGSNKSESSRRINSNVAAAVVAGICLFVALTSYGALMIWRTMTNARYANRAMLLTDDDMGDIQDEDLRHFEAACIQIEG